MLARVSEPGHHGEGEPEAPATGKERTISSNAAAVRIDKWLWAARFYKTRSAASKAVSGGKVHLNGRRPKRSSDVRIGDRVRVRKRYYEYELIVEGLAERRGPASEAAELYRETARSQRARERRALQLKTMPHYDYREGGRPTKKERRELDRMRGYRKK